MFKKYLPKSEFAKNTLTLMTGTTLAQAIPMFIAPILTRLYTPKDFGVLALYMAIVSICSILASGRYELAIMLPKKDEDAANIAVLSVLIISFVSLIIFLIVFFLNDEITNLLGNPDISGWLYFVPISVLLTGFYQSLNCWSNRRKRYQNIAKSRFFQSSASSFVSLAMSRGALVKNGLVAGFLLGQIVVISILGKVIWQEDKLMFYSARRLKIIALFKKYSDFPKYSLPTGLLDVVSMNAPLLFISKFYETSTVGYYSFTYRLLQVPMSIIGSSISQVFYQRFSELQGNSFEQKKLLIATWKKLFFIGFLPFATLLFKGPDIFGYIFGRNWIEAGRFASILSVMLFFVFISSPTSSAFTVLRMQKKALYFGIYVLIARPTALFIGYKYDSLTFGLTIMVVLEVIQIFLYNLLVIVRLTKDRT